ncbi:MAG: hypothetical protein ACI8PT_001975 [Gammaproteobacteria bacterium]|jgi:hypothetical protein
MFNAHPKFTRHALHVSYDHHVRARSYGPTLNDQARDIRAATDIILL